MAGSSDWRMIRVCTVEGAGLYCIVVNYFFGDARNARKSTMY